MLVGKTTLRRLLQLSVVSAVALLALAALVTAGAVLLEALAIALLALLLAALALPHRLRHIWRRCRTDIADILETLAGYLRPATAAPSSDADTFPMEKQAPDDQTQGAFGAKTVERGSHTRQE